MNPTTFATTASMVFALAACGGGGPSQDEIADGLVKSGAFNDESQALCVAERIKDSGLSENQLRSIADGNNGDTAMPREVMDILDSVDLRDCF